MKIIMHRCFFILVFFSAFFLNSCKEASFSYDCIIRGGMVYDGSGRQPFRADVGIKGDTIAFIGDLSAATAAKTIDAKGMAVSPGFIDTHSHHTGDLFKQRHCLAAISQGITTIIIGQDGNSDYPLSAFYEQLSDTPVAINIGSYSGHNTLRDLVLGNNFKRPSTNEEIGQMRQLLKKDLEAGALGLSTGLEYDPGIYSSGEEVMELAKVVTPYKGRYISHIRSEDRAFWKAIEEIIAIGTTARIPVQISHVKLGMRQIWGKASRLLMILDSARKHGVDITADLYPYTYWHSTIKVLFPERNFSDTREAERILKDISWPQDILLGTYEPYPAYAGKTLLEIAVLEKKTPAQMLVELIARVDEWERAKGSEPEQNILVTAMDESDIKQIMQWPHTNICSDGAANGKHPRGYGAFTRVLGRYVREAHTLSLQEAIHKMTALAAAHVGIEKRGSLKPGYFADLVVLDPLKVQDESTVVHPHTISSGILHVWVNGKIVYQKSQATGAYPGMIIRR